MIPASVCYGFLLLAIGAILEGIVDIFDDPVRYETSIFKRWPERYFLRNLSQWNKYRRYRTGEVIVQRWNSKNKPIYFERFPGSTTFFSWICDGYGLGRFLSSFCTIAALGWFCDLSRPVFWLAVIVFFVLRGCITYGTRDVLTRK